jgi:hypothetical protein
MAGPREEVEELADELESKAKVGGRLDKSHGFFRYIVQHQQRERDAHTRESSSSSGSIAQRKQMPEKTSQTMLSMRTLDHPVVPPSLLRTSVEAEVRDGSDRSDSSSAHGSEHGSVTRSQQPNQNSQEYDVTASLTRENSEQPNESSCVYEDTASSARENAEQPNESLHGYEDFASSAKESPEQPNESS